MIFKKAVYQNEELESLHEEFREADEREKNELFYSRVLAEHYSLNFSSADVTPLKLEALKLQIRKAVKAEAGPSSEVIFHGPQVFVERKGLRALLEPMDWSDDDEY